MTKEEAIEVINACLAENVEVDFVESKLDTGHMIRFTSDSTPIQTYSVAMSRLESIVNEAQVEA
jgi:hypothetical protein